MEQVFKNYLKDISDNLQVGNATETLHSFHIPALYEIKRWTLQWGADAEVLKPEQLRYAVAEEAKAMIGIY